MAIHGYFTVAAILLGASVGGTTDVLPAERTRLVAAHEALAGIEELRVALVTQETPQVEKLIDVAKLRAQVIARLKEAGIRHEESDVGSCPRLIVQIENVTVSDCGKCVCRVQTFMSRVVTFTARRDMQVEAEVWRLRPAIEVAAANEVGRVIAAAVLAQVEVFVDAYTSARRLQARALAAEPNTPGSGTPGRTQSSPQNLQAASPFPFVASRNGSVFHRADCRWAQNISADNRVGYKTREEALQAGKRPCKTCQP
jgi:hypothetical protein